MLGNDFGEYNVNYYVRLFFVISIECLEEGFLWFVEFVELLS